jgi:DNA repair ATPase RecN
MLDTLHIRNYALINELEIQFDKGLNMITGETGAGKSIIMGALSLILGNRAEGKHFFDPTKKCVIEGNLKLALTSYFVFLRKMISITRTIRLFEERYLPMVNPEHLLMILPSP